ncbi:hypothetical protein [Mesorhizobium sp. M0843]|uniref:hypothetical protein n=1 Tax=Mesorhizobium sp. M0843 TaxID=2957010 RepID=UPI00333C7A03
MINPVRKAREDVCQRVGANIYGRVEQFLAKAEVGDDQAARDELMFLMRFFPRPRRPE